LWAWRTCSFLGYVQFRSITLSIPIAGHALPQIFQKWESIIRGDNCGLISRPLPPPLYSTKGANFNHISLVTSVQIWQLISCSRFFLLQNYRRRQPQSILVCCFAKTDSHAAAATTTAAAAAAAARTAARRERRAMGNRFGVVRLSLLLFWTILNVSGG
jgi:hypothetical protein